MRLRQFGWLAVALSFGATAANADTYLCTIKPKFGEITIAPELAVQVFEDHGTARVMDGVINTVQPDGAIGKVERRPALTRVSWDLWLDRKNNTKRQDGFTYRVAIMPDGRAIVTANINNFYRARSTGHCRITETDLDNIGTFGQRLDKPLRKF